MNDSNEWFKRWVLGAILPLIPLFYGIQGLILRTSFIAGHHIQWKVVGPEAVPVSLCYLFLAVFLHVYFCWENRERLAGYRELLLVASLLSFLASAGYFAYLDFRP